MLDLAVLEAVQRGIYNRFDSKIQAPSIMQ